MQRLQRIKKTTEGEIRPETLLTSHEAGLLIQMNPSSINKWVKEGRIEAHTTPGGHRRIKASDFVTFLVTHRMPIPMPLTQAAASTAAQLMERALGQQPVPPLSKKRGRKKSTRK